MNLSRLRHVWAVFEETSPDENVDRIVLFEDRAVVRAHEEAFRRLIDEARQR